jgi:hypothetical protein
MQQPTALRFIEERVGWPIGRYCGCVMIVFYNSLIPYPHSVRTDESVREQNVHSEFDRDVDSVESDQVTVQKNMQMEYVGTLSVPAMNL